MADLGVMEMCWGLGSLSPLRDRLMAFSPAGRSASDSRDKTRRGGGPKPTFILTADENAPNLSLPVEQTNGKEGSEKRDEEGRGGKGGGEE